MILDKFTRIMRPYKDPETGEFTGKYPDNMSFKVVKRDGNFMCKFYDENRKRINVDNENEEDYVEIDKIFDEFDDEIKNKPVKMNPQIKDKFLLYGERLSSQIIANYLSNKILK